MFEKDLNVSVWTGLIICRTYEAQLNHLALMMFQEFYNLRTLTQLIV